MPRGPATISFFADDVAAAAEAWYAKALGTERLLELGATSHGEVTERGPGFSTASVLDPFGNILGVMYNQHHVDTP